MSRVKKEQKLIIGASFSNETLSAGSESVFVGFYGSENCHMNTRVSHENLVP